jgi:hypothetical protein
MYDAGTAWVVTVLVGNMKRVKNNKLTEWKRVRQELHFSHIYNLKVIQERAGKML